MQPSRFSLALLSALALLALPAGAQTAQPAGNWHLPHDRLYSSAQPDGSPQVRGSRYKAEFTREGASYVPFLGSAARANHPLRLRLESIRSGGEAVSFDADVPATQSGDSVRYARGGVTERYDLALDSIEQSFVFDALPSRGELVVRLGAQTDLQPDAQGDEFVFGCDEGGVRYGAATAIDARGERIAASTKIVDGALEIRVPAAFVEQAALPLVIDPVITTFTVGPFVFPDDLSPSICWDESHQRWCVVYEQVYSLGDHDAVVVWLNTSGVLVYGAYVDTILTDYWAAPDVAIVPYASQYYIVAVVGQPSGLAREIHGRTLGSGSTTLGPETDVSLGDSGDRWEPSVGGDSNAWASAAFTVVWTAQIQGHRVVHMRQVDSSGVLRGTALTVLGDDYNSWDFAPRISKSCGGLASHHAVWQRQAPNGDNDVYGAEIWYDGTVYIPATPIAAGAYMATSPSCSTTNLLGQWLLAFEVDMGTHHILAQAMTGMNVVDVQDLSTRESELGSGAGNEDHRHPAAECDGLHFVVAYSESFQSSPINYDIRVSTLDMIGGQLYVGDTHQVLDNALTREDFPRLCSKESLAGSGEEIGCIWWSDGGAPSYGDMRGAVYLTGDFSKLCSPGSYGVTSCPCGNPPASFGRGCNNSSATGGASLVASGNASIAADTVVFTTTGEKPTATSIVMQGQSVGAGVPFGQGIRCVSGTLKRLYSKTASGGSITAPMAGDPSVSARSAALGDPIAPGNPRYYFVYYRDPVVLGACPSAATFNATDSVQAFWLF